MKILFKLSFHNIPYKLLITGELEYILRTTDFILFYLVVRMIIALRYISGIVDHHCLEMVDIGRIVDHHYLEMVVHFVDIGRIVDHLFLSFLFIIFHLRVLRFPPPIKLIATIKLKFC